MDNKHPASDMGCSPEAVRAFDRIVGDKKGRIAQRWLDELSSKGLVDVIDGEPVIPVMVYRQWERFSGK